jgi:hypothetical protein
MTVRKFRSRLESFSALRTEPNSLMVKLGGSFHTHTHLFGLQCTGLIAETHVK